MVLRRPFFLDALSRLPAAGGGAIRSEIDLVELWWEHGGADGADFASAQRRRNVLFTLGERLLANPGFPLAIRDIDPTALDELLRSGVLRQVEIGISVAFAHDIYEEWVLERVLRQRRSDIAAAIREGHQDLQRARPLQLLAAFLLERSKNGDEWAALLQAVSAGDLRATWSRVVLAAPVRSVRSVEMLDRVEAALLRDDGRLMARLIRAVRTTETERDLRFLDEKLFPNLSRDQREQYASEAAGPGVVSWMRLISWLVPRLGALPQAIDAELVPLFDSWAGASPPVLARHAFVPAIAAWALEQLGDEDTSDDRDRTSWTGRRGDGDAVRALLLKCAGGAPEVVRGYLAAISDRAIGRIRKQIVDNSIGLAVVLPDAVTAFIRRTYFLDHDRSPERSRSPMRERSETLGFDEQQDSYPASPSRPPFLQLLRTDADTGLEFIRSVCNHAMEGWRRSWRTSGETRSRSSLNLEGGLGSSGGMTGATAGSGAGRRCTSSTRRCSR